MRKEDRNAILQAAARTLGWQLFAAAGYGRLRNRISLEEFDHELRSALHQWSATHRNLKLNHEKEQQ